MEPLIRPADLILPVALASVLLAIRPVGGQTDAAPWVREILAPQYFAVLVEDVDRAVGWYRTTLGLESRGGFSGEGEQGPYRIENLGNDRLIVEIIQDPRARSVDRAAGLFKVGFRVPDVDAVADRVERATGERPRIIDFSEHRVRILQLRDPEGTIIQLTSPMPGAATTRQEATVQTRSGRIAVDDGGSGGVPVVFLHSLGGRLTQWSAQLDRLRPDRRAVALDLPGHGGSPPARDGDHSLERMTATVAEALDSLGLGRFILVGHSFGAGVAMRYAGTHPDRVAGLLLADPVGDQHRAADQIEAFADRLRTEDYDRLITGYWESILPGARPHVREAVVADLRAAHPDAVVGAFASMASFDARAALATYDGPILLVRTPLNDFPISLQNVLPGLREEVVEGTGHWLQMDEPARFNELLVAFIDEVEGGR